MRELSGGVGTGSASAGADALVKATTDDVPA
jgi:hypothetical protein